MSTLAQETGLQRMSLARFAAALASAEPAPGGSCAAALPAALAAGLVAMVARLTAESDLFSELSYDMDSIAAEADDLRTELVGLVDEDASAFDRVMDALRLPGARAEQRAVRSKKIRSAYEGAVEPPVRACLRSLRVLELASEVAVRGNPNAAADAGVAVLLAAASLEAAALTVELDVRPIHDEAVRAAATEKVAAARARLEPLREAGLAAVRAHLARY